MFTMGKPVCAISWNRHEYATEDGEPPWTYRSFKAAIARCTAENGTNPDMRQVPAFGNIEKD